MPEQFNHFFDQLRRTLYGENPWIWMLALLGFSIIIGLIVRTVFIRFLRVSHRRQGSVLAGAVLKQLSNRTRVFFPLLIFFILQPLVYLEDPYDDIVFKATKILFFVTVGWLALKLINALEDVTYAYYAKEKHNPFRERKIMPITYFIETPFQNWTRNSADLTGAVMLYVDYSLPVDELRQALHNILVEEELWDHNDEVVQVVDTTDKTMTLRVLVSAADAASTFKLRCSVREKLIYFIQEHHPEALPKNRVAVADPSPFVPASQPANHTVAISP